VNRLRRTLGVLRDNWRDPSFWLEGPEFVWRHVLTAPLRRVGWAYQRHTGDADTTTIADADWDNCIVLDACRYDTFESVADPSWDLRPRLAAGSDTGGYLAANYPPSVTESDLVYVNANARVANEPTGDFHEIRHVWQDEWNDEYGTVMPEAVCAAAREAAADHPDKRLLVHLVQPHIPYIGPTADDLPSGAAIQSMRPGEAGMDDSKPYAAVKAGIAEPETVRAAYRESLELAMEHVEALVDDLRGKSVVTADHGDLLGEHDGRWVGEFSEWGHPANTPAAPLVRVPFAVPPFDDRKTVRDGTATDTNQTDPNSEQLEALGYR
jgi:hypothetical protein